jgi:hypothetical protein
MRTKQLMSLGILILSTSIFSSEITQYSNNLFQNSTFDKFTNNIPTGWKFSSWNRKFSKERISKNIPGHGGSDACVELVFGNAIVASSLSASPIAIKENQYYLFKGYYASTFGKLRNIQVIGNWQNSKGKKIGSFRMRLPRTQDQWCPFFREIKSPSGSTHLALKIEMKWDDGRIRFDDFSLREGRLRDYKKEFAPVIQNGAFFPIYAWIPPGNYNFYNARHYPKKSAYFDSDNIHAEYASANFTVGTSTTFGTKKLFRWQSDKFYKQHMKTLEKVDKVWGFMGKDEPREPLFPKLTKQKADLIKFADKNRLAEGKRFTDGKPVFNNLLPIYAFKSSPIEEYIEYVSKYIKQVQPTFLTYDFYPLVGGKHMYEQSWFTNLEIIRKISQNTNLHFGVFCASAAFCGVRSPNESEMRWEAFSSLCYGSRFLGWFTFMRQINSEGLRDTIINENGDRTWHYSIVKRINAEVLTLAPTLLKIKSTAVYHTKPLPPQTTDIANSKLLTAKSSGQWLLGEFSDEKNSKIKYFMLTNKDFVNKGELSLTFKYNVAHLYEISKINGTLIKMKNYNPKTKTVELKLNPGDGRLFVIKE